MNTKVLKSSMIAIMAALLITISAGEALAQRGAAKGKATGWNKADRGMCSQLPDLTEDQQEKITDLKTSFMKETIKVKNEMAVKRAELKAMTTGDDVNLKEVNAKIDEIADLKAYMMKKHAAHRQDVRALLTEEQQVIFDQHGSGYGKGMGKGRMHRSGKGFGPGPGNRSDCPWRDNDDD